MRKFFTAIAALLLTYNALAQSGVKERGDFLQKSKKKKTTGWILLGAGVATTFIGPTI